MGYTKNHDNWENIFEITSYNSNIFYVTGTDHCIWENALTRLSTTTVKKLSVASDGTIFAIDYTNGACLKFTGSTWLNLGGIILEIAALTGNIVYGIGTDNCLWKCENGSWTQISATQIKKLSVASDGTIFAIDYSTGNLLQWTGSTWTNLSGVILEIAAYSSNVCYVIGTDYSMWKYESSVWTKLSSGPIERISISSDNTLRAIEFGVKNILQWNITDWILITELTNILCLLSGKVFNHLETQYDYSKSDIDSHNHNTRYYTKTLADNTFFTLINSVSLEMDADKLDGEHYTDLLGVTLPVGAILAWSGTDSNIPTNWHICDGGTYEGILSPDLRNRFVPGSGNLYANNSTGGPETWNGIITPTANITIADHILTLLELPNHDHTFTDYYTVVISRETMGTGSPYPANDSTYGQDSSYVGGGGAHGHSGSSISFNTIDPRPKYYSLYYIIKYR